jgi:hypothetical protein
MRRRDDGFAGGTLGAEVLGVDIASNLVAAGRQRAIAEGLTNCKFQEGDASNLHDLKDRSFDLVVTIFGAMFAPKPFDVAKEMGSTRSDIGGSNLENQYGTLAAAGSFVSPMTWRIESNVIERFAATGVPKENVSFLKDTYTSTFPGLHRSSLRHLENIMVRQPRKGQPRRRSAERAGSSVQ